MFHGAAPVNVQVPVPNVVVLVFEFVDKYACAVMLLLFALKVPFVIVRDPVVEKASCMVSVPPGASSVNDFDHVFVLLVSEHDERHSNVYACELPVRVIPEIKVRLPNREVVVLVVNVGELVAPVQSIAPNLVMF